MIELKEVSKAYNKKNVFEDVNLKLEEGKVTAIVVTMAVERVPCSR